MAKRREFGRIDRLPSQRYRARYPDPTPGSDERIPAPKTFATKTAAQDWLNARRAEIAAGTWVHPDEVAEQTEAAEQAAAAERAEAARRQVAFGRYAAQWVAERTSADGDHLRPRTRKEYERLLAGVLAPWADVPLNAITPAAVRTWRAREMERGTKTQTARAYDLMKSILKTAVEDRLIEENPCKVRGGSKTTPKKIDPPTEVELDIIIEAIEPRYKPLVIIAAAGGLRFGEALALTCDDVLIERTADGAVDAVRINVTASVTERTGLPREPGPPKSAAGTRLVSIFGRDAEVVAEHVTKIGEGLLWTSTDGGYVSQSSVNNHWRKARAAAGRDDLPFHGLRHYAGTRYAQFGATVAENMVFMGHSTSKASMRYQHATRERADDVGRRAARSRNVDGGATR